MKAHTLELDKIRNLRFGFKAMREIRMKFGEKNLDQLLAIKVDEIPALVFYGLKHEDKDLTLERVEELLDDVIPEKYTILKATEIIISALADQMGIETKKEKAGDKVEEKKVPKVKETIPSSKKGKKQPSE